MEIGQRAGRRRGVAAESGQAKARASSARPAAKLARPIIGPIGRQRRASAESRAAPPPWPRDRRDLTRKAFFATRPGGSSGKKCTPAMSASVVTTISRAPPQRQQSRVVGRPKAAVGRERREDLGDQLVLAEAALRHRFLLRSRSEPLKARGPGSGPLDREPPEARRIVRLTSRRNAPAAPVAPDDPARR